MLRSVDSSRISRPASDLEPQVGSPGASRQPWLPPGAARKVPWWMRVLIAYLLSRVVTSVIFAIVVQHAHRGSRLGPHAGLQAVITAWDGQWYQLVAAAGYPSHLPTYAGGVAQNTWAFLPLYPLLVKALSAGAPGLWAFVAAGVSLLCGAAASLLLFLLLRPRTGDRGALIAALLFMFSPVSFLLQVAYADALGLALLFGVLLLVDRRRYGVAIAPTIALSFTRPGGQALGLLILLTLGIDILRARRDREPLRSTRWTSGLLLAVVAVGGAWAWPWIASAVTGVPNAYVDSELAWRNIWSGTTFEPILPWFYGADFWFGRTLGPWVLGALIGGFALLILSPGARLLGPTVRLWSLSWSAYLLLVFAPQSSIFRLLMPLAPLGGVLARIRTGTVVLLIVGSIALQGVWVFCLYGLATRFWAVP